MSETEKPQPGSGEEQSGAEAPTQPERPAGESAQAQQVPPAPPVPPPPVRREPRRVRVWVAAVIAAGLLLGGGLGGYFIGAANDNDRPGIGRGEHWPGDFRGGPFRGERPGR